MAEAEMSPLIDALISLGPTGVVVAVFLWLYHQQQRDARERERELRESLTRLADQYDATMREATEVLARLDEYLRTKLA